MHSVIKQNDFDINEVLDKPLIAHLSSLKAQIPCNSPLWFLYEEMKIWLFGTHKDSFINRLVDNPKCAISIVDFNLALGILKHVGIRGEAQVIEPDTVKLDKFLCKYLGSNKKNWNKWFIKKIVIPIDRMVVINPGTIVAKDVSYFNNKI